MKNNFTNSLYIALIYTISIGFFMYLMHYQFGYKYGQPEMVNVLIFFEILAGIALLWLLKKNHLWQEVGLVSLKKTNWKFALPILVLPVLWLIVLLLGIFENSKVLFENTTLMATLLVTIFLVGFTEEVVFRGLIFNNARKKFPLWAALLIAATSFALVHSVNILGGSSLEAVLFQLLATFIAGLFFCLVCLKTKNLWIPIFIHFIWDLYLFMGEYYITPEMFWIVAGLGVYFEYLVTVVLILFVLNQINKKTT